jgi:hypothetical protein
MHKQCLKQTLILTTLGGCEDLHETEENHKILKENQDGIWSCYMLNKRGAQDTVAQDTLEQKPDALNVKVRIL